MVRPTLPADGVKPWGDILRTAVFDVSDRADNALSAASSASTTASSALSTANSAASTVTANAAAISALQASLAAKADDNTVVKLTGNQTVSGIKTFNSAPVVPDNSFTIAKIQDLQANLNSLAASGGGGGTSTGPADWNTLLNKPTTFPPTIGGTATTAVAGNDARLTDQRIPTDGSVTNAKVSSTAAINVDKTADGVNNKVYTAADKTKLSGIAPNATANATDAFLRDRGNHIGTQDASTITGLATVATSGVYGDIAGAPQFVAGSDKVVITPQANGTTTLDVNIPGALPTNLSVRYVVRELAGGGYPASPAVLKEFCGVSTPTGAALNIGDYDLWTKGGATIAPVAGTTITPAVTGLITNNWAFALPTTGIATGQMVLLAIQSPSNPTNTWTLTVTNGANSRVIPETTSLLGSGYAQRVFAFYADANTAGATATFSAASAVTTAVRMLMSGKVFDNIASVTPVVTKSTIAGGLTRTAPAVTTNASSVVIQIVTGTASAAPAPASYTGAGATILAQNYHTASTAYLAMAIGSDMTVMAPGTSATRTWSSFDATGTALSVYTGIQTLAFPVNRNATSRLQWDGGAWNLLASGV